MLQGTTGLLIKVISAEAPPCMESLSDQTWAPAAPLSAPRSPCQTQPSGPRRGGGSGGTSTYRFSRSYCSSQATPIPISDPKGQASPRLRNS